MGSRVPKFKEPETMVERRIVECARSLGGIAYKFVSPARRNVPDRLILLPGGRALFIEAKAEGRKASAAQAAEHGRLRRLGFEVHVCDTCEDVDTVLGVYAPVRGCTLV